MTKSSTPRQQADSVTQQPGGQAEHRQPPNIAAITGDAPAAVLLVDLTQRAVVHVNPVARQLAPRVALPISVDAWSDAAALRDVDGAELSDTEHPLSKIARSEPVAGQAVSAGAGSDLGHRREPLWVVALPMVDAPMLTDHALVVLLPLRDQQDRQAAQAARDAAAEQAQLRDRAVVATGLSFTVADARAEDMPLVWVNPAFTATTGYDFADAVGHNCRFLQGPGTDPAAPKALRAALEAGESISVTLLNYRKDGLAFWNQVAMSPICGADGELTHFVGIQTDVSGRVAADEARDAALAAEKTARAQADAARAQADAARKVADHAREQAETARRQAETAQGQAERARAQAEQSRAQAEASRAQAERSRGQAEQSRAVAEEHRARLALLAQATERLSGTLDVAECRQRLIDLVVPQLGDLAMVVTTGSNGRIAETTSTHRDPHRAQVLADRLQEISRVRLAEPWQTLLSIRSARRINDVTSSAAQAVRYGWLRDLSMLDLAEELGVRSMLMVPIPGRGPASDVLVLAHGVGGPTYTEDDLDIAVDLARRAGLILDNARLFEAQHRIASTLQASLLPELPAIAGVQIAARYQAAEANAEVGGDFYEVIDLPDVGFAFAIGDVVGHDVYATAAMGHLKGLLRACAWDRTLATPADVLRRVDELIGALGMTTMATLTYGHLAPATDAAATPVQPSNPVPGSLRESLSASTSQDPPADAAGDTDAAKDTPDGRQGWVLHYSSAGHPPLMVREPDGTVHTLSPSSGIPLGIDAAHPRTTSAVHLAPGSIVLAYTDGLIERREEILTVGLDRLAAAVAAGPHDVNALCQHLLDDLSTTDSAIDAVSIAELSLTEAGGRRQVAGSRDDVALLALHL